MLPVSRLVRACVIAATRSRPQHSTAVARQVAQGTETGEEVKAVTGQFLPPYARTRVGTNMHIFNGSDCNVYVEVTDDGELRVKPPKSGAVNLVVRMES